MRTIACRSYGLRRRVGQLPDDPRQRIVLFNVSDRLFEGCLAVEPWFEQRSQWDPRWQLCDEAAQPVPYQIVAPEAAVPWITRLLIRVAVKPQHMRVLYINTQVTQDQLHDSTQSSFAGNRDDESNRIANNLATAVDLGDDELLCFPDMLQMPLPHLDLIEDHTDTWSHGSDRYGCDTSASTCWNSLQLVDNGKLRASIIHSGSIGRSSIQVEYRVYGDDPFVEVILRIHWCQQDQILKYVWPLPATVVKRMDGIPHGSLQRPPDGREYPLRDWILLKLKDGRCVGVVCPDVFGVDVTPRQLRLTLLRSPLMAHNESQQVRPPRALHADQGVHEFHFRFFAASRLDKELLEQHASMLQDSIVKIDLTRGMLPSGAKPLHEVEITKAIGAGAERIK